MTVDGDMYWLYPGVCKIPDLYYQDPILSQSLVTFNEVPRAVCRSLCSIAVSENCSGMLYISANRTCVISSYNGEYLESDDSNSSDCLYSTGNEFYYREPYISK